MRDHIARFCLEYEYPIQAREELLVVYDRIQKTTAVREIFSQAQEEYAENPQIGYWGYLDQLRAACREESLAWESVSLLFFICLVPGLIRHYEKRGLSLALAHACMEDLKWKLMECRRVYGVWGSFVADWFPGFFQLTRFTLGRLQFELLPFPEDYEKAGRVKPEGVDRVINIHIPSSGPLIHEECVRSYRLAAEFFGELPFFCDSWLLFPKHRDFLPADSRILEFMSDFDIYTSRKDPKGSDLWRIFGLPDCSEAASLPEKTSVQRAYKGWLLSGNEPGAGKGIFMLRSCLTAHSIC